MKRERLFEAIGAADPALVEHSGRAASPQKWVKWSGLCAACLTLAVGAAFLWPKGTDPSVVPDTPKPNMEPELISLRLDGGDVIVGGRRVPLSKHRRKQFLAALAAYWGERG